MTRVVCLSRPNPDVFGWIMEDTLLTPSQASRRTLIFKPASHWSVRSKSMRLVTLVGRFYASFGARWLIVTGACRAPARNIMRSVISPDPLHRPGRGIPFDQGLLTISLRSAIMQWDSFSWVHPCRIMKIKSSPLPPRPIVCTSCILYWFRQLILKVASEV